MIDVLRRAGAEVTVAKVHAQASVERNNECHMSRGVWITAEKRLGEVLNEEFDAIALPGGLGGAQIFAGCHGLTTMLK